MLKWKGGDAAGRISLCPGKGMEMYGVTQTNGVGVARQGTRSLGISQTRITARAEAV